MLHGTNGFTSPPKEGMLRIFIAFKNLFPRPSMNPLTLRVMASKLTTTPPRRLAWPIRCSSLTLEPEANSSRSWRASKPTNKHRSSRRPKNYRSGFWEAVSSNKKMDDVFGINIPTQCSCTQSRTVNPAQRRSPRTYMGSLWIRFLHTCFFICA
jgi:hypothetical protein